MPKAAWFFLAIALVACKRDAPEDAHLGCYAVVETSDARYAKGDRVCFLKEGVIASSERSLGEEAFEVAWSVTETGFRGAVPSTQTGGAKVEVSVTRLADGEFEFKAGEGWMKVRLGERTPPDGQNVLDSLRSCRACIDDSIKERGAKEGAPAGPIYSLRSCTMFLRVVGAPCAALGLKGR